MIRVQDLYIGYVASIYRICCIYISDALHLYIGHAASIDGTCCIYRSNITYNILFPFYLKSADLHYLCA